MLHDTDFVQRESDCKQVLGRLELTRVFCVNKTFQISQISKVRVDFLDNFGVHLVAQQALVILLAGVEFESILEAAEPYDLFREQIDLDS